MSKKKKRRKVIVHNMTHAMRKYIQQVLTSRQSSALKTQSMLLAFFFQNLLFFFTHQGNKGPDVQGRGFACPFLSSCGRHGVLPLVWAVLSSIATSSLDFC
jgi:hypothetical protein